MMELRWLERKTGKQCMNEWGYYYDETVRILQYRQQETVTDYRIALYDGSYLTTKRWTDWADVPTVSE